jgi:hypothetical protein
MSSNPLIQSLVVIESLPRDEKATGTALVQHLNARGCEAVCFSADTELLFIQAIQDAERRSRSLNQRVALHFEVHGDPLGFQLADGALVGWHRVKRDIQNLNFAQQNHLLVSMAVCSGLWLLSIMRATDVSPFGYLVAYQHELYETGIERGFPVFYESLFAGKSLEEAVHQLNLAQDDADYRLVTSEKMFENVYRQYYEEQASPAVLRARANAVFDEGVRIGAFRPEARKAILDFYMSVMKAQQRPFFEKFREKFFMHDVYPGNQAEFCPSYEDLGGERAEGRM